MHLLARVPSLLISQTLYVISMAVAGRPLAGTSLLRCGMQTIKLHMHAPCRTHAPDSAWKAL